MLPILFKFGPITIYSFGFVLGLGFFLTIFMAWRRLKDIGLTEEKILDMLILATGAGVFFSWIIFRLQNYPYRGVSLWGGLVGFGIVVWWFCKKEKWDFGQILDELTFSLAPFGVIFNIGLFLDGSGPGKPTSMPWGIFLPGNLFKSHPVSIFSAIFFFVVWLIILQIERDWRGWKWVKSKDYGFIFLAFSFFCLAANLGVVFLSLNDIYWLYIKTIVNGLALLFILILLISRTGLWIRNPKKRTTNQ